MAENLYTGFNECVRHVGGELGASGFISAFIIGFPHGEIAGTAVGQAANKGTGESGLFPNTSADSRKRFAGNADKIHGAQTHARNGQGEV